MNSQVSTCTVGSEMLISTGNQGEASHTDVGEQCPAGPSSLEPAVIGSSVNISDPPTQDFQQLEVGSQPSL